MQDMKRGKEKETEGCERVGRTGGRKEGLLTFNVTVYDLQSVVEIVQSLKQLEGVVESCLRTERATLKHIFLQAACKNRK